MGNTVNPYATLNTPNQSYDLLDENEAAKYRSQYLNGSDTEGNGPRSNRTIDPKDALM